jgi:phage terminase large subunit-like protein
LRVESPYTPQAHQARFHGLVAKEKLFLAGVGAGKTVTGLHEFLFAATHNKECDGMIVSPTYPMFRDVIVPAFERWVHPSLYTYKRGDRIIIWHPTGKTIFIRSATEPGRISGPTVGHAWFDEAALVRRDTAWKILQARVRDPRAVRPTLVATTTPEGYNWLIRAFAQPGRDTAVLRARTADNRHLPDDFEPGLRAAYGDEYAAQYLDAEVLELSGLAWPIAPAIHSPSWLTEEYARAQCRHFFGAVDWGFKNPAALLVAGIDDDGRWYLIDSWYKRAHDRAQVARQAKIMQLKWNCRQWYIDHDPEGERHMRKPIDRDPEFGVTLPGLPVTLAEKQNVETGVAHVRTLVSVRHDGWPHLFIAPHLKEWFREQEAYTFPEDSEIPIGAHGDHLMDDTRYLTYTHSVTWAGEVSYLGTARGQIGTRDQRDWEGY